MIHRRALFCPSAKPARRALATLVFALATTALASPARAQSDASTPRTTIEVVVGVETSISAAGVQRFSSTGPSLDVRVSADGQRLLIRAALRGRTTLLLVYAGGAERAFDIVAR